MLKIPKSAQYWQQKQILKETDKLATDSNVLKDKIQNRTAVTDNLVPDCGFFMQTFFFYILNTNKKYTCADFSVNAAGPKNLILFLWGVWGCVCVGGGGGVGRGPNRHKFINYTEMFWIPYKRAIYIFLTSPQKHICLDDH